MKRLIVAICICLLAPAIQSAFAFDFSEFGAVSLATPHMTQKLDPTFGTSPELGFGFGATLGMNVYGRFDLEAGIAYVSQSFNTSTTLGPQKGYNLRTTHFPAIVRYWISDKFSVGGGMYYVRSASSVTIFQGSTTSNLGYSELGWNLFEFGICLSARYRAPLTELISLVIDAREFIGLTNRDVSGQGTFQTRTLHLWTGIAFIL